MGEAAEVQRGRLGQGMDYTIMWFIGLSGIAERRENGREVTYIGYKKAQGAERRGRKSFTAGSARFRRVSGKEQRDGSCDDQTDW